MTDKVYDAFVDAFVGRMKGIIIGNPTEAESQPEPLSSKDQVHTVKG